MIKNPPEREPESILKISLPPTLPDEYVCVLIAKERTIVEFL
jgi:hypothetical protein